MLVSVSRATLDILFSKFVVVLEILVALHNQHDLQYDLNTIQVLHPPGNKNRIFNEKP